jgi:hypothetical protein
MHCGEFAIDGIGNARLKNGGWSWIFSGLTVATGCVAEDIYCCGVCSLDPKIVSDGYRKIGVFGV